MSAPTPRRDGAELKAFLARLHFYIGLFVGPFLLVAALTGLLYVATPQLEEVLYRPVLRTDSQGMPQSLAAQLGAARAVAGPEARFFAIRPAPAPGQTTRVMFTTPGLGDSESRAIFIDPVTLAVLGDHIVYGTSGVLPLRTGIDYLHRNLMLGEPGRLYSELAASWLWVATLGGVLLWLWRDTGALSRRAPGNRRLRTRRLHGLVGVTVALGLLFLSATGLTWSRWAGERIDTLRGALGWVTPSVSLALQPAALPSPAMGHGDHAHHGAAPAAPPPAAGTEDPGPRLDAVLAAARAAGIDLGFVEIRPPRPGRAWLVREYDRSWPTQVDSVAIDPATLRVTSRADFASFPLVARLIRWGIDLHMGVLFGVANQILVGLVALGLIGSGLYGYRIWWQNRPPAGALPRSLAQAWLRLGPAARLAVLAVALALGWALPVAGASLVLFLLVDGLRWRRAASRARPVPAE